MALKFLQKRSVALLLAVLTVLGSTVCNININLNRRAEAVEALWEERNGPEEQLSYRRSAATQLCSVLSAYPSLDAQTDALRSACRAWPEESRDLPALYAANEILTQAAQDAYRAAEDSGELNERDLENAGYYYGLMENTDRVLRESAYNDAVDGYRALLSSLPLRLLRPVIFVETPAYFRAS